MTHQPRRLALKLAAAATFALLSPIAFGAAIVGQPAPAFTANDLAGKPVSLSDFKGKTVLITGASYGLGASFAEGFAGAGASTPMRAISQAGGDLMRPRHKTRQTRRQFGGGRAIVGRASRRIAPLRIDPAGKAHSSQSV